jgi:hypothetical protein
MAGMVQRLLGNWQDALEAYAAAASGAGQAHDELPEPLQVWLDAQVMELQQLHHQHQQQQQQPPHKWKRTRLLSRLTTPGGDGSTYISIVMVGRHDNTQVPRIAQFFCGKTSCWCAVLSARA